MINAGVTTGYTKYPYIVYIIKDMCLYRIQTSYTKRPNLGEGYLVLNFVNKHMDYLNIGRITRCNEISTLFPVKNCKHAFPTTSYKRGKSIRSDIVNYRQTILKAKDEPHICHNYPSKYVDGHHSYG